MTRKESENCFDYIRYYAAFCVMFLHFTGHVGHYLRGGPVIAVLRGVSTFFQPTVILLTMSGFLASASFERGGSLVLPFLKKRIKRIYIDMWLSMAVYVAVFYYVVGDRYDSSMLKWLIVQGIGFANTPDCLKSFATGSFNGTMWFFTAIIQLYFVIANIKKFLGKNKSLGLWVTITAIFGIFNILSAVLAANCSETVQKLIERTFIPYAFWFFVGVLFQTCKLYEKERIKTVCYMLLAIQILLNILPESGIGYYTDFFRGLVTSLLTVTAAYCLPAKRVKLDITYGLYLYHWLFLNLIIYYKLYEKYNLAMNVLIFVVGTVFCAFVFRIHGRKRTLF